MYYLVNIEFLILTYWHQPIKPVQEKWVFHIKIRNVFILLEDT